MADKEYIIGRAKVRIHGEPPTREQIEPATVQFLKKVLEQRKRQEKERKRTDG